MRFSSTLPLLIIPSVLAASLFERAVDSSDVSSADSISSADASTAASASSCPFTVPTSTSLTAAQLCSLLNAAAPNQVFYPGEAEYVAQDWQYIKQDIITATCLVEPKNSLEVSILMQIIKKFRPQWAVRGRGHNHNRGFAGTTGIMISMTKFNGVTINSNGTVSAGTGLRTTDVYDAVASTGKTIIGGRTKGPGVSGVTLGGGMSWLVNEHGIAIDGLASAELVTPSGAIKQLSATQNTDLWWAIRGGGNRFGIVTRLTFTLYPIGKVSGGTWYIGGDGNSTLIYEAGKRLAQFDAANTDPKASINWILVKFPSGAPAVAVNMFYNAPTTPASTFAMFTSLPNVAANSFYVNNMAYNDFITATGSNAPQYPRAALSSIPIRRHTQTYVKSSIDTFYSIMTTSTSAGKSLNTLLWVFEPFVATWQSNSKGGAWPHETDATSAPTWYVIWDNASDDTYFNNLLSTKTTTMRSQALSEGIISTTSPIYQNYVSTTQATPSQVWQGNLPRLKQIYASNDPTGVMQLTGGWNLL